VACTNLSADVGRSLPASSIACTDQSVDVKRGLATSSDACAHLTWHVRIGKVTLGKRSRTTAGSINQGLHAPAVMCAHRMGDINFSQQQAATTNFYFHLTWPVRFECATSSNGGHHHPGDIGRGLPVSPLVCTQRSADVGHGQPISPLACTQ